MTEKEMKKLSRLDLLNILVEQSKENDTLKNKISKLEHDLEQKNNEMIKYRDNKLDNPQLLTDFTDEINQVLKSSNSYLEKIKKQHQEQVLLNTDLIQKRNDFKTYISAFKRNLEAYSSAYPEFKEVLKLLEKQDELV